MIGSPSARRHAIVAGAALLYAALTDNNAPLVLTTVFALGASIWRARGQWTPQGTFGLANVVPRFGSC